MLFYMKIHRFGGAQDVCMTGGPRQAGSLHVPCSHDSGNCHDSGSQGAERETERGGQRERDREGERERERERGRDMEEETEREVQRERDRFL